MHFFSKSSKCPATSKLPLLLLLLSYYNQLLHNYLIKLYITIVFRLTYSKKFFSIIEPTRYTICFHFITINSLYMFPALICSSLGGTVYTVIGIFCAYYVSWLLAGLEWNMLAAILHNTLKIYQLLYIQYLLMISKQALKSCRGY
jgi:hypothetical protein